MSRRLPILLLLLLLAACGGDKPQQLLETARFEEQQMNKEHAIKLYREIVSRYPDSPAARQARERLAALGQQ